MICGLGKVIYDYLDSSLRPTIEAISVMVKNIFQKVAGSWNTKMPTSTVPTAPMRVHTGYAMPMGSVCVALASSAMLTPEKITKPPIHSHHSVPMTDFARPRQ